MINVESVSKTYNVMNVKTHALNNVSFNVREGEIYGLIGLSGAGKSTALRTLNLLEVPDTGRVLLDGSDLVKKIKKS